MGGANSRNTALDRVGNFKDEMNWLKSRLRTCVALTRSLGQAAQSKVLNPPLKNDVEDVNKTYSSQVARVRWKISHQLPLDAS